VAFILGDQVGVDLRVAAEGDMDLGVAALMGHHEAVLAMCSSEIHQGLGHGLEGVGAGEHAGQRIDAGCIESAGDDYDVGFELVCPSPRSRLCPTDSYVPDGSRWSGHRGAQ